VLLSVPQVVWPQFTTTAPLAPMPEQAHWEPPSVGDPPSVLQPAKSNTQSSGASQMYVLLSVPQVV
jgi:hypothetical protein